VYADIEAILCAALFAQFGVRAVTELPAELRVGEPDELPAAANDLLPIIQVARTGGGDDDLTLDAPRVDIDVLWPPDDDLNPDRDGARRMGERIRTFLRTDFEGRTFADAAGNRAVIALVRTLTGPHILPWDDTAVRRCGASYEITAHSTP